MSATSCRILLLPDDLQIDHWFPEKTLLAAVLERSHRDLGIETPTEPRLVKKAIAWFRFKDDIQEKSFYITFKQCAEVLGLTASQIRYLESRVEKAEELERQRRTKKLCCYRQEVEAEREVA